jgi:predicted nuclease of restriction endonuclease-like (RecB) superfamily
MKEKRTEIVSSDDAALLAELRGLIESAQVRVAQNVNRELVLLYWDLGQRIRVQVLAEERAEYGARILPTLSAKLKSEFGDGFSERNLARMIKCAETFPERATVEKLSEVLSWSHFVEILALRQPLERDFYATLCHASKWSVRGLRKEIAGALFTRTALARQGEAVVRGSLEALRDEDKWTPDLVLRDPYVLDFLGLPEGYSERDLEAALVREMERFLLELGQGFAFVERQKRMVIDGRDFHLDLLFYHRRLRRLVAVDLKIGPFEPAFKGQMELYLRWLDKHERAPGEEAPIGLLLCTEAGPEQLELLQIGQADIHVAEYVTQHLPPALLEQKLREAQRRGLAQLAARERKTED